MTKTRKDDELVFLPLGGSNEIGMNFNLYGFGPAHDRKWIVVDLGVTFGDLTTPGVEIILPDPAFIEEYADDIIGIVLTHAHEDHIGALGWLWPRLRAPLYATPFTAFLIREKLREKGILDEVDLTEIPLSGSFSLGPFELTLITLTHSIPEPNGLAIKTPLGTILHTAAAKLPRVAIQRPASQKVIGTDTVSAMQSGVYYGYVGLMEGLIARIKREYGRPMTVVATGGVASLFVGATQAIDKFDGDLTIRGMLEIWRRNTPPEAR